MKTWRDVSRPVARGLGWVVTFLDDIIDWLNADLNEAWANKMLAARPDDEWTLTPSQMFFMLQHHNAIEAAYETEDMELLRSIADSDEYKATFGDMPWDEAYDRYESRWIDGDKLKAQIVSSDSN